MDNTKAMIANVFIERQHECYLRTQNANHAWRALEISNQAGVNPPRWVLEYLMQCAQNVPKAKSPEQISQALRLQSKGGPSKSQQAEKNVRDYDIAYRVLSLKDRPTKAQFKAWADAHGVTTECADPGDRSLLDIQLQVADEFGLSLDRVIKICSKMTPRARPQRT